MSEPIGPFRIEPQPGDPFVLTDRDPLVAQWPALLERLPPKAHRFVVRDENGRLLLIGLRPVEPLTDDPDVTAMSFDVAGKYVATGHSDGGVRLWDVASPDPLWSRDPADEPIEGLAFVEQGPWVLAWCEDGPLLVIARETGELVTRIEDPQFASFTLAVSPRGDEIALTGYSVMRIALPGGEMRAQLDPGFDDPDSTVLWVDYLADASMLVGIRASAAPDGPDELVFWNAEHGARTGSIPGLRDVCACDLSPDRKFAAIACSNDGGTKLVLVEMGLRSIAREIALPHHGVQDMRFAPDGASLWVTDLEHGATRIDLKTGAVGTPVARELASLSVPVEGRVVPDSDESQPLMVTRNESGTLELTSLASRGPFGPSGRAISADGSVYAFSDEAIDNNRVIVCDTARNAVIATLSHRANVQEVWVSPDGSRVLVRAAGHVYVWPLDKPRE